MERLNTSQVRAQAVRLFEKNLIQCDSRETSRRLHSTLYHVPNSKKWRRVRVELARTLDSSCTI